MNLEDKSLWYRQPFFVATMCAVLTISMLYFLLASAQKEDFKMNPENIDVFEFVVLPGSTIRVKTEDGFKDFVTEDMITARAVKKSVIVVYEKEESQ